MTDRRKGEKQYVPTLAGGDIIILSMQCKNRGADQHHVWQLFPYMHKKSEREMLNRHLSCKFSTRAINLKKNKKQVLLSETTLIII